MVGLLGRDHRGVGGQWEVDSGVRHKVGLEFCKIHIQCSLKAKGSSDGADDLRQEAIEVGEAWSLDVEIPAADVIDGLVVDHEGTV